MSVSVPTERDREMLRREHGVRAVSAAEEGVAAADLPVGVYGFTSSPALASPMFAGRRYRNFEVHRLPGGPAVVGFVTPREAESLKGMSADAIQIHLYPDAEGEASAIVAIGYGRIVHHRQYSIRNAEAIVLNISPRAPHYLGA
jgi:hypothetical protein